jgi:signal transduction histidine kinase
VGDVRGAISVSVPMDHALSVIRSSKKGMLLTSVATISILMIVLFVMMKELVLSPVKQLMVSMQDFSRSEKHETTIMRTGDELEDLSKSFVEMSRTLTEYHNSLENKVQQATKSLEQANASLTELNEKKSDFIAKISHELRTPMTSIKGAMDYLIAKIPKISQSSNDTRDIIEFLGVIKKNADRLIRMVNDTLDLERIESGILDLHLNQFDMISLIKEAIISFQTVAAENNITFTIVAHSKVFITADEDMIRQVLINLISNAINFSPHGSEIRIAVTDSDKTLIVSLTDNGPGIPDNVKDKIFDKFYTIGKRHGTGLGLSICKGIIEAHKGEIKVSSTKRETGSTIFFTLPQSIEVMH